MSETKDAVDRLCFLCKEAVYRVSCFEEENKQLFGVMHTGQLLLGVLIPVERQMEVPLKRLQKSILKEPGHRLAYIARTTIPHNARSTIYRRLDKVRELRPMEILIERDELEDGTIVHDFRILFRDPFAGNESEYVLEQEVWREGSLSWKDSGTHDNHWLYSGNFVNSQLIQTIKNRLEDWVRVLTAESEKLRTSPTTTVASRQDKPEVEKPTSEAPTIEEVCNGICQTRKGKQTLKKILTLTKEGKTPVEIASRNSNTKGFSLPNISEKLKIVRERFPGFLPD